MKNPLIRVSLVFLLAFSFSTAAYPTPLYAQAPQTATAVDYSKGLQAIETMVDARRRELGIPGVSLVIVKDDKIIYAKGLGYKDLEDQVPVTPDTQFAIGSATKAFTALTVLMAQDEGKLSIDDHPNQYLPYFKMYDPDTDKNIQIRDLMCHSSGLNRTDLAMITGRLTRAELIQVAAQAKPTAKLRQKFQYQNIMFTAAGEIAATVEKTPYNKLVTDRILHPLGMRNTSVSLADMERAHDYSFGYNYNFDTKKATRLPYRDIEQVAPAGAINSSANDMAKWLRFVLDGGVVDGKRLVSQTGYDEWTSPQMQIVGTSSYGFGWFIDRWHGLKVLQHGGNIDGFNSQVAMIPEKHLGFVLLTNVSASSLGSELMPVVWQNLLGGVDGTKPAATATAEKVQTPADLAAAAKLVGTYVGPGGRAIEVKETDGKVTFNIGGQQPYALAPIGNDTFSMSPLPDTYFLTAKRDAAGKVASIVITQPEGKFEFARAADAPKITLTADELAARALAAIGGEANWRALNSSVVEANVDLENQGVQAKSVAYAKAPNKAASETTLIALGKNIGSEWDYFDGSGGGEIYTFAPPDNYEGKRLADARLSADFHSMLDWKTNYKRVEITGIQKVGDEDCYVVDITPNDGTPFKQFYSTTTFLLMKQQGQVPSSSSEMQLPYTILYSDYREVNGVKVPFHSVNESISMGNIVTNVTSVKFNTPVPDSTFAPREVK